MRNKITHQKAGKFRDLEYGVDLYAYKYQGELCPYVILDDHKSKRIAAYHAIRLDLMECKECLDYININRKENSLPKFVTTAILFKAISQYAKCFNEANGGRGTYFDIQVFKGAPPQMIITHKELMDIRDSYLAHAANKYEKMYLIGILNPEQFGRGMRTNHIIVQKLQGITKSLDPYLALIDYLIDFVERKTDSLERTPYLEQIGIDAMYNRSKLPPIDGIKAH